VVSGGELMRVLLARPWSEETAQQVLEVAGIMQASGENAIELVDNMLDLARAGHEPRDAREVPVGEVLKRVLEERRLLIEKKGVKVEAGGELGRVRANPTHIYQLFANLVGNAVKYNDNPAPRVAVEYLGEGAGGAHRYLVRDNGTGIPEEDLERVFDPFFKGESGGTGIGLAIVEKIVKTYKGEIRACNDNGACFEFSLKDYVSEGGGHG
jgi:two-component system sensor histidine kinase ResE